MAANKAKDPPVNPEGSNTDTPPLDDDTADVNLPCGDDEDPELYVGDALKDPWDDSFQTDWPQNKVTA